jgi:type IV pilus assembly protein PilE
MDKTCTVRTVTRACGFTLIELLVALVILALLASQAYPAFHKQVIRVRRQEAQAALLRLMQQEERYFTQANTYIAFSSSSTDEQARQFKWWSGNSKPTSGYEIEGKPCEGELISQCVRLVATPGTTNVDPNFHDTDCEQLTLTSTVSRLASGPAERCWP